MIARRSVRRPEEISYYIAYCPAETTLDELIRVAGNRWAVEECFQTAKQECGLNDYQVRRYDASHRHMTPAMAAHACLTALRARELDTGNQKRTLPAHTPHPPRTPTPDPPPRPPPPGTHPPHPALVTPATATTVPGPHQPLQTTRPHTTRSQQTITENTIAVLGSPAGRGTRAFGTVAGGAGGVRRLPASWSRPSTRWSASWAGPRGGGASTCRGRRLIAPARRGRFTAETPLHPQPKGSPATVVDRGAGK
ncbi:hypothetical protein GCM10009731_30680 [Streptomyces globosus]